MANGVTGIAKLKCTFYKGTDRDYVIMNVIAGGVTYEAEYKLELGNSYAIANMTHEVRKFVSLVPSANDAGTPKNIKTNYYFKDVKYSNAKITKKVVATSENWNYDHS